MSPTSTSSRAVELLGLDLSSTAVLTVVVAALAVVATLLNGRWLRRTGKGTVRAAEKAATAAQKSADAAGDAAASTRKSADAAMRAATGAERAAAQTESRSRREEIMRSLRWAAELALGENEAKARLGVVELQALAASHLTDRDVQAFVDAALDVVVGPVADAVERYPDVDIEPASSGRSSADDASASADPVDSETESEDDAEGGEAR